MEKVKQLGNIFGYTGGNYSGNVYDSHALSPTLNTMQGGNKQPMIIENQVPHCFNSKGGRAGIEGLQPSVQDRVYDTNSVSVAVTTSFRPSYLEEPKIIREQPLERGGWHRNAKEVLNVNGLCRTLNTQSNNLCTKIKEEPSYRIRKLTPKECWRLMGFDDEAFEKAEKVNSNTQLYKQAGNSIVVAVLMAIFDNLLIHSRSAWLDELLKDDNDS